MTSQQATSQSGGKMRIGLLQSLYEWSGVIYVLAVMFGAGASFGLWWFGKQLSTIQASRIAALGSDAEKLHKDNLMLESQIATAREEAAKANERAALLMKSVVWRSIDGSKVADVLKGHRMRVHLVSLGGDPEGWVLTDAIEAAFRNAGITDLSREVKLDSDPQSSIIIFTDTAHDERFVAAAFVAGGLWGMEFDPPSEPKRWGLAPDQFSLPDFRVLHPFSRPQAYGIIPPPDALVIYVGYRYPSITRDDPRFTAPKL